MSQKMQCFLGPLLTLLWEDKNRLTYTVLVLLNHFAFGISINILGACLVDLGHIYDVSIDDASYIPAGLGVGYFVGALAGFLYRYIDRQLILGVLVSILAVIVSFLPHYGKITFAIASTFCMGIGAGSWDGSQTSWMVDLWPKYPTVALQTIQFLYGLGSIVAPLLAAPFVYGEKNVTDDNVTITVEDRIHSLTVPFAINGILQILVPITLLILYFIYPYQKPIPETEDKLVERDLDKIPNRIAKLTLGALCIGTYTGLEMNWIGFAPTMFQHVGVEMGAKEAAHVAALLLTTYTIGRCLTALVSNFLQPDFIALGHFSLIFVSLGLLYVGQNSRFIIYFGSAVLGYGFSAMNAAIFAFSERHLKLTDRVCSIFAFSAGIFSLLVPAILTQTFKTFPEILYIICGILLVSCFTLFIICKILIYFDQQKQNEWGDARRPVSN